LSPNVPAGTGERKPVSLSGSNLTDVNTVVPGFRAGARLRSPEQGDARRPDVVVLLNCRL